MKRVRPGAANLVAYYYPIFSTEGCLTLYEKYLVEHFDNLEGSLLILCIII